MVNEHESSLVNSNLEERITTKMILIRPPYPPKISPKEILLKSNQSKRPTKKSVKKNNDNNDKNNKNNKNDNGKPKITKRLKSPNAFIIYRNEFVKELRKNNYKIRQSIISPMSKYIGLDLELY
ncbi:12977_t:CDS:2 [Entrophospora sp. SA101]|nr:12977_t:CDS:2 [Entrophospora sp. SA101]